MSAEPQRNPRSALITLALLCVVLVTHGSLYPWRFELPADSRSAMLGILTQGNLWTGLGDAVGNIVLFAPVGLLGVLVGTGSRRRAPLRLLALLALGIAFAFALQVLQIFVPARSPAIADVVCNTLGLVIGMLLAALTRRFAPSNRLRGGAVALALVMLWLALEWWPFVPTIDWQHVKDALKPLLLTPRWTTASAIETALGVAVVGYLLRSLRHRALLVLALVALAGLGKLFVSGQSISLSHAIGLVAGLPLAGLVWRMTGEAAATLLICASLVWTTADALRPYELAERASRFSWIPFVALLQGSLSANALALAANLYWLGVVMVLAAQLGGWLAALAIGIGLWVLMLELVQTWLPGRTADITPALLPMFWLVVLRAQSPSSVSSMLPPAPARRASSRAAA